MPEFRVTINAIISVDDPQVLDRLILCRMIEDESGEETISAMDDDFEVVEYPDNWLDFNEIIKKDNNNEQ